jgi:transposase InsO family protein
MIELQMKQEIQSIRSDCGGEFLSKDFTKLCEDVRIQRQLTNARTPKQNNMVE